MAKSKNQKKTNTKSNGGSVSKQEKYAYCVEPFLDDITYLFSKAVPVYKICDALGIGTTAWQEFKKTKPELEQAIIKGIQRRAELGLDVIMAEIDNRPPLEDIISCMDQYMYSDKANMKELIDFAKYTYPETDWNRTVKLLSANALMKDANTNRIKVEAGLNGNIKQQEEGQQMENLMSQFVKQIIPE